MSLQDQFAESSNPALQARVQMAIVKLGADISTEPTDTPNHPNRVNLATQVVRSPTQHTQGFTTAICAQGITAASTDDEITTQCSAVWNAMAGPEQPSGYTAPATA